MSTRRVVQSLVGLVFLIHLLGAAVAQTPPNPPTPQTIKTIFDYKTDLKLTDEQDRHIRQILLDLNRELQLEQAKHTIAVYELQEFIKKEADLDQIRAALDREAAIRAAITYADIAATRKINKVLLPEQLAQWRSIQDAARNHQP
jgi:Spy/CpxP family protein refolding chaperone